MVEEFRRRKLEHEELEEIVSYISAAVKKDVEEDKEHTGITFKIIGSQVKVSRFDASARKWDVDVYFHPGTKRKDGKKYFLHGYFARKVAKYHPDLFKYSSRLIGDPGELMVYLPYLTFRKGKYKGLVIDFLDDYVLCRGGYGCYIPRLRKRKAFLHKFS